MSVAMAATKNAAAAVIDKSGVIDQAAKSAQA
jgi:hypothetical protein